MDKIEMSAVLRDFTVVYDKFKASPEVVDLWTEIFRDYDFETVKKAALRVMETNQYSPKPSDLKAAIGYIKDISPKGASTGCSPEEKANYRADLAKRGIVVLPNGDYARREDVRGAETKMDYCLRVLGGESVTRMLKEHLGGSFSKINPIRYKKFLNEVLVPMAEQDEKTKNFYF